MKKVLSILLALVGLVMVLSLAGCGDSEEPAGQDSQQPVAADSLELLTTVWNSYGEDEKFPVMGGDLSEENMTMDAPGKYSLEDAEAVDGTFGLPAANVGDVEEAATIIHMMNANSFTCAAYKVKAGSDAAALAAAIQENLSTRQWLCGFPDKLTVTTVGDYLVACFGSQDLVDNFAAKLTAAYPSAATVVDQPLV